MKRLGLVLLCVLVGATCFATGQTEGKEFPSRTIENIFPWGAGGALSKSQIIATAMAEELGVSMTVVTTPGASGTKAFQTALHKPANGYTIIDGYVAPLVLQPILGNADWSYTDFKPLSAALANPFAIATKADETRWSNFEEMMEYGRQHPGELRYTSHSRNNHVHMVIAKVLESYGVVAQQVPYSPTDATKDIKSGVLDFGYVGVPDYQQDEDAFNILLVLTDAESAIENYGNAPSIADLDIDLGLTGIAPMGWTWWLVHPDTPEEETRILREAMERTMAREDVRASLIKLGCVPLDWTYESYEEVIGSVQDQLVAAQGSLEWERKALAEVKGN